MSRRRRRSSARYRHKRAKRHTGHLVCGTLEVTRTGYGFVDTDKGSYYIARRRMGSAMNGDTVEIRLSSHPAQNGRKRSATVVRVRQRAVEYVHGTLSMIDSLAVVTPIDPRLTHDIFITTKKCSEACDGDFVLVRITDYPTAHESAQGYIVEVFGRADEPGMDINMLVYSAKLPTTFSPQALEQAESINADIEGALAEKGVRDLCERDVFTIDPVDAQDFDDAISLDHVNGLVRLGVHIADVSSYVEAKSSIDICARDRSTSIYLVDRVLAMLPEKLSNDICSLQPSVKRRTISCDIFLDKDARVVRYEIYPSVIISKRRFTYDEVQAILDLANGSGVFAKSEDELFATKLCEFNDIAKKLAAARAKRGALDFDSIEAKPVLDLDGHVKRVDLHHKTQATSMIEQAMILANEIVATHMFKQKNPLIYRIHEAPQAKSLEALLPLLKQLGFSTDGLSDGEPRAFLRVLTSARGKDCESLVNYLLLRSMERARYSTTPESHFGLASAHYCHFTSPIRRYPDLVVHRLLKMEMRASGVCAGPEATMPDSATIDGQLELIAEHCSKMERVAEQIERDSVKIKLAQYLKERMGEVFEGVISTVLARGFFVRLDNTAEGFVRIGKWPGEVYSFDTTLQTLTNKKSSRTYCLGQRVRVYVVAVDVRKLRIDFELA